MRILVTGAAGRIGSRAVSALLGRGHEVRGFDLRAGNQLDECYQDIVGSLVDDALVREAMAGVDAVLHLGAYMSWDPAEQGLMFQSNVEGTSILLEAAKAASVNRFVFASSGEVYPENAPQTLPVTEDHPLHANSPYGLTKLLGEELVRFHQRTGDMDTVILRFSHTQDASELLDEESFFSGPRFFLHPRIRQQEKFGNHAIAEILRAADPGTPAHVLARNEHGRPFQMHITDTRDIVQGLILALEHKDAVGEVFNLGATEPVDFERLLSKMSAITQLPVVTVDLPGEGAYYQNSNAKMRSQLGFAPEWTIDQMLIEAQAARKARMMG
ncbi:NAD(P)-dependent oxidoreductase [uncultured Litoreibacter sp.]|uniref:NAD-dependent epimerase/dehydratase family protein n=1 Tax=uncultured Litoreibacter sp. TaxID=1392394 RepID=UPI002606BE55|nr:NAD(P)-dependent oxidoreductase [uncultured Litoreibacter sp.]